MASSQPLPNNNPNSKRRRFQAPITNFFTPSGNNSQSQPQSHNYESPTFSPSPALPHKIQSSLLTVGMRIRKSVPEGYKTQAPKTKSYPEYFAPSMPTQVEEEEEQSEEVRGTYSELPPFSGMFKTGGLAVQTFPRSGMTPSRRQRLLFDHQGKVFSSGIEATAEDILPPSTRKRSFARDEDEDSGDEETEMTMNFPPNSSQQSSVPSLTPSSSQSSTESTESTLPTRQILQPRFGGRRRFPRPGVKGGEGQENKSYPLVVEDDFEEASFLQRREDVEMEIEI
ncbi:hypothetical protein FQN54_000237 [Arachnomyces sp. PD_36]|nr:hypothetical protein FQN54_000237 [Arachnomyces sp. PD_36]